MESKTYRISTMHITLNVVHNVLNLQHNRRKLHATQQTFYETNGLTQGLSIKAERLHNVTACPHNYENTRTCDGPRVPGHSYLITMQIASDPSYQTCQTRLTDRLT